jgi:FG-GAP-like repeat
MKIRVVLISTLLSLVCAPVAAHAFTLVPALGSPYFPIGPVMPSAGGYLGGLVAGDFTGNGVDDLAVVDETGVPSPSPGESVTVFLGSRTGGLTMAPGSPVDIYDGGMDASGGEIATADFTGDGHLDLAVVDEMHDTVSILLGDGSGRFVLAGPPIPYAGGSGATLVTGDFNGDGRQDIAVVAEKVTVLLGNGSGGFSEAPGSPLTLPSFGVSAAAGDFNGDGRSDLAVGEESGDVRVLLASASGELHNAPGSPVAVGTEPRRMVAADLTSDGNLDLATANPFDDTTSVLLGNGRGSFTPAPGSPFPVPDGNEDPHTLGIPESIGVGDFVCEGVPSLAIANFNGFSDDVAILEGNGNGSFTNAPGSPFSVNGNPRPLAVGDFDGDGALDVAVVNSFQGTVTVLDDTARGAGCGPVKPPQAPVEQTPALPIPPQIPAPLLSPPRLQTLSFAVRQAQAGPVITLRFFLAGAATVVAELERVVRHRVRHHWRTSFVRLGLFQMFGRAGLNSLTISQTRRLRVRPGRYRVVLYTELAPRRSQTRTIALTVRR